MKRVLVGCVAVLALALAVDLGADMARSSCVDPSATGIIALWAEYPDYPYMLDQNGVVWRAGLSIGGWAPDWSVPPLPVPVSEVKCWSVWALVTTENRVWRINPANDTWVDLGVWPGSPAPAVGSSWGTIKAAYRR